MPLRRSARGAVESDQPRDLDAELDDFSHWLEDGDAEPMADQPAPRRAGRGGRADTPARTARLPFRLLYAIYIVGGLSVILLAVFIFAGPQINGLNTDPDLVKRLLETVRTALFGH